MVYNFLPFMVFPIYTLLSKMDYRLTEAAADLGCNNWQTLWKVTMPLSIPGIVGSALSLIMMVLILISLSILRKADPNGEGGGIA